MTEPAVSVSIISESGGKRGEREREEKKKSIVATHPHAKASWRGRALCPAAERKHRYIS